MTRDFSQRMSRRAQEIRPSGIRKFFDLLGEMKDVVSLTVGQPDFVTPWHIRAAAIESLFLNSQQALSGQEDVTEQTIDDLLLYNIAVDPNGCVHFYLYYDPLGYICLVYDNDGSYAGYKDAVTVMEQWYLLFDYEGLRG